MRQKTIQLTSAIAVVGLLIALALLPGIAGLIEGDFDYFFEQVDEGWNNKNNVTKSQALTDIYAWSFWRIGLRSEAPVSYSFFELIKLIKSTTSVSSHWE